jgi:hypothetical protein
LFSSKGLSGFFFAFALLKRTQASGSGREGKGREGKGREGMGLLVMNPHLLRKFEEHSSSLRSKVMEKSNVMHSFMLQFVAKCQLLIDDLLFCSVVL